LKRSKRNVFLTSIVLALPLCIVASPAFSAPTLSTQRLIFSKSEGILGFSDGTNRSKDWSKYYGDGLAFLDAYAEVGSTISLKWFVSIDGITPLPNTPVSLLLNKACSSSNGKIKPISGVSITSGTCGSDGAIIKGITDSAGEVTFSFTNANSEEEGEVRPANFDTLSTASLRRYTQVALIVRDQTRESIDIVDIHWIRRNAPETTIAVQNEVTKLIWSQEFNGKKGSKVDSRYWTYDLGGSGWGNGELQNYQSDAVELDGKGNLVITAKRLIKNKKSFCLYGFCEFSSGRIVTRDRISFKYGKIEARIKMPSGGGTWPAFWTLGTNIKEKGWPKCGEIDIIEAVGNNPKWVSVALHGPEYSGGSNIGRSFLNDKNLSSGFHTYGIEWMPGQIRWLFDGNEVQKANKDFIGDKTWVFDTPQYLILNVAMGGTLGGEISSKFNIGKMKIDWLRVSRVGNFGEIYLDR